MEVSFRTWLADQVRRDDPIGDVARDVVQDCCLPLEVSTYPAIRRHMVIDHGASYSSEDALSAAAREWGYVEPGDDVRA